MYSSHIKILLCGWLVFMASVSSYGYAQSTGTTTSWSQTTVSTWTLATWLTSLSRDRYTTLSQKRSQLEQSLQRWTWAGVDYRDMVSVLQCLQIPFADGDQASMTLFTKMSGDMDTDRQAIDHDIPALLSLSTTDVRVSLMRQLIESTAQKYTTMMNTISASIDTNRVQSLQSIDRLIGNNRPLLNQLLSDKKIIDTMITTSTQRQQKMWLRKTSLGFTQTQMDTIIAGYRQQMSTVVASWLEKRATSLSRKYKDIIPFADYIQQEEANFLTSYQGQINDRFAQRLGDPSTGSSYIQRLHETVALMQQQFYQWTWLQCGLLTTMTPTQRSNYRTIIADLKESIATLPSSTTVTTGSISLSTWFVTSLNTWYASSYNNLLSWFALSVTDKASLRKKAIRAEKDQINAIQSTLIIYRQATSLAEKKTLKEWILSRIVQMQKQWILSHSTQKSLDRITKELRIKK